MYERDESQNLHHDNGINGSRIINAKDIRANAASVMEVLEG